MDEPYKLSHQVHKPIIQEVKEIIQPYRNIVQQVKPVIEDIRTIVPKDNDVEHLHQMKPGGTKMDWNAMTGYKKNNLRPPPRQSPANQMQNKFYTKRPMFDSVKTSESQSRIQRRMQFEEQTFPTLKMLTKTRKRHNGMQFGSSEPDMVYHAPAMQNFYSKKLNSQFNHLPVNTVHEFYKGKTFKRKWLKIDLQTSRQ